MLNKQGEGKIDWTSWSWNPLTGCLHNCDYCYLKRMEERFKRDMTTPAFHPERLNDLNDKKLNPGDKIFVSSSGDAFGNWVEREMIQTVIDKIKEYPQYVFQFLTKNPIRYMDFDFPKNCWLGVTIESIDLKHKAYSRYMDFRIAMNYPRYENNIKFISFEPLLGEIPWWTIAGIDWIIVGANSNPGAEKPPVRWLEMLIDSAVLLNVPVWVKDNYKYNKRIKEFPRCNTPSLEKSASCT